MIYTISTISDCIFDNDLNCRYGLHIIGLFLRVLYKIGTEALLEKSGKVVCVLVYVS